MSRGDERQQKSLEWQFLSRRRTDIAEELRPHVTTISLAAGWLAGRLVCVSGLNFLSQQKPVYCLLATVTNDNTSKSWIFRYP